MEREGAKPTNRLLALEGVRGIAAIVVVFYHALLIFYAFMIFGPGSGFAPIKNMRYEDNVYGSPIAIVIAGTFAVALFFVLSGFVLSVGFFQTGKSIIVKKLAAKRYFRLMLPALSAIIIAWLLISLHLSSNATVYTITHSGWLGLMWNFQPNFFDALQQGTWGIFASPNNNYYDPVLWTMFYEFAGSFIVFMTLLVFGTLQKRWIVYLALIALAYQTWFLGFIFGMILADLYSSHKYPFNRAQGGFMGLLLIVGLVLGAYPGGSTVNTIYQTIGIPGVGFNQSLMLTIGAVLVIGAVISIPRLNQFFAHPRISGLGRYTFSLYLTHKLVLFTVCTGLFVWLHSFMGFNKAALLSLVLSLPVIVGVTVLFEKYIDARSIRFAGVFANWLLGLPQKEGVTAYSEPSRRSPLQVMKDIRARLNVAGRFKRKTETE